MQDYYKILGVERDADADTIKRAYRKLASLYHPDKEGGSKTKFQEVEEAYRTLGDPNKRQQYDNPRPQFQGFSGFGQHNTPFDIDAIFSMFGARFPHGGPQAMRRTQMTLWITLQDVAQGGRRTITIGTQHGTTAVDIEIPLGISDGDNVQYGGIGPNGSDLIISYRIHPNPKYERRGQHIIMDQPISVWDLMLGAEVTVTDVLNNRLNLTVPAGTQPGTMLRLRGKGLPHRSEETGDLLVRVQAVIPDKLDPELKSLIEQKRS